MVRYLGEKALAVEAIHSRARYVPVVRYGYLDGLRALAALYVLVHHSYAMVFPISQGVWPEGPLRQVTSWAVYGHFGVALFIALAGYSLTLGVAKHEGQLDIGFVGFMKRRAWRIIPPYWAAMLLTLVLVLTVIGRPTGTHWDLSLPTSPQRIVVGALLLQDVIPIRNISYTFWSIAVEWHIYLMLPLMLLIWRKLNWGAAVALGVGISALGLIAGQLVPRIGPVGIGSMAFTYYLVFVLAVGACIAVYRRPAWLAKMPLLAISGTALAVVVIFCSTNDYSTVDANFFWLDALVGISAIGAVAAMATGRAPALAKMLSCQPLSWLARSSYSLYLVHAPLLQVFWQLIVVPLHLPHEMQLLIIWTIGVPIMIAAAYVFYLVAEKPFVTRLAKSKKATALPALSAPVSPPLPLQEVDALKRFRSPRLTSTKVQVGLLATLAVVTLGVLVGGYVHAQDAGRAAVAAAKDYKPEAPVLPGRPTLPAFPPGSKVLFIGDSWTEGVGASDKANGNWAALTADHFGWERHIDGIGGTGFTRGGGAEGGALGTDNNQYINRLDRWIADPGIVPDLVFFEGGLNDDRAKPEALGKAVREVVAKAKEAWPSATVIVMGPAAPQPLGAMLARMADPIANAAIDAGAFSINPVQRKWFTTDNSQQFLLPADGAHVNDAGHRYTSERLASAIQELQTKK